MIIACVDRKILTKVKDAILQTFPGKDLGFIKKVLGLEVEKLQNGNILLLQRTAIKIMIENFRMDNSKGKNTPMLVGTSFEKETDMQKVETLVPYRSLVGSLLFVAGNTRPDISFATSLMARFCEAPNHGHWEGLKQILKYLSQTIDYGLLIPASNTEQLCAFVDSDFAAS